MFRAPDYHAGSNAFFSIASTITGGLDAMLEAEARNDFSGSGISNAKVIETRSFTIDGKPPKMVLYNYGVNSEFNRIDIILKNGATDYYISFLSHVSFYDQYLPIAQKMIQSFDAIDEADASTNDNRVSYNTTFNNTTSNGSGGDNLPQLPPL